MSTYWRTCRLGDIARDLTESRTFIVSPDEEIVDPTIRSATHAMRAATRSIGATVKVTKRVRIMPGDLVFSRLHTQNGAFAFATEEYQATGTFIPLAVDENRADTRFLFWALHITVPSMSASDSVGRETYKTRDILGLPIPLPPLAEQKRIVAQIEKLAARIQEASRLRQQATEAATAVLTSARRAILSESNGQTVTLEKACAAIVDNLHSNPRLTESGIPCVRSPDVGYGTLNLATAQRTDEEEYRRRTVRGEPQVNDIVLVREGGGTGKCAVVPHGQRFSLGQRVMMLRPNVALILPHFFLHYLLSPLVQEEQIAPLSKGSASPHLNIGALKNFTLRLPPLREQRRIVEDLDGLQSKVGALTRMQAATGAELDALLPAILDRAFKGELV